MATKGNKNKEQKPIEQTLWDAANKLRGKVEPAEYKHVVLSMIFLKYANDRFSEHREQMIANGQEAFLEMMPLLEFWRSSRNPEKDYLPYLLPPSCSIVLCR